VCAVDAVRDTISLQEKVYSDGEDGLLLMEQIGDSKQNEEIWSTNLAIREAIENLPERERQVLNLRYYVGKTQMEISKSIGISQAQVSRLEKNALGIIKECL
ncbi:MAG: sigma-70 family RNA polymerase sigma factor, partial [Clostridia bacterium]|nr:sigma-70 family RNA polymerase sigma factor [Clostridia bacterium]